jgi:ribonuclease HIII
MNEQDQQAAINALKEFVLSKGWSITEEKDIQSGYQLVVTDGITKNPVSFFVTGKVLIQGKAGILQTELQAWEKERNSSKVQSEPTTKPSALSGIGRTAQFYVSQSNIEQAKHLLTKFNAQAKVQEPSPDPYQFFRIDIYQGNERVVATQYKSGKLLIQGRMGELFEDVCKLLEKVFSQSFAERGARYVPDTERDVILEHMSLPQTEQKALDWVYDQLGREVYEFLPSNDRETHLSGAGLLLSIKETNLQLPDYSIIVMPFARTYEGSIIQLAVQLGITNQAGIQANAESMRAGGYINQIKERIDKSDKVRHTGLADTLLSAWRDVRNKVLHSDPVNPSLHPQLVMAEQDIQSVNRAMRRAHKYLIELGIVKSPTSKGRPSQSNSKGFNTNEVQTQFKQNKHSLTPPDMISNSKAISIARIGSDESGKGDYFGPLVISAVYVDEKTETQLIALGVRDSKRLADKRILTISEEIEVMCPNSIVQIGPKRYNELYQELHNLNKLLAWGHARSLENVLGKVTCELAVADQFGDQSFLLNALMKKGRQIKLEQRPRAEEDIAVAAASILARARFVQIMEQLSKSAAETLPKGASDPAIVTIGRRIVASGGREKLAEFAKLHFKTTEAILQS